MEEITMIVGLLTLFVVSFVAWYTRWHRTTEVRFEKVPVSDGRARELGRDGEPGGECG